MSEQKKVRIEVLQLSAKEKDLSSKLNSALVDIRKAFIAAKPIVEQFGRTAYEKDKQFKERVGKRRGK